MKIVHRLDTALKPLRKRLVKDIARLKNQSWSIPQWLIVASLKLQEFSTMVRVFDFSAEICLELHWKYKYNSSLLTLCSLIAWEHFN